MLLHKNKRAESNLNRLEAYTIHIKRFCDGKQQHILVEDALTVRKHHYTCSTEKIISSKFSLNSEMDIFVPIIISGY